MYSTLYAIPWLLRPFEELIDDYNVWTLLLLIVALWLAGTLYLNSGLAPLVGLRNMLFARYSYYFYGT